MDIVELVESDKQYFIRIRFRNGKKFMNSERYTKRAFAKKKAMQLAGQLGAHLRFLI